MSLRPDQGQNDSQDAGGESRRVFYAIGLTRAGMLWEEIARSFWPALVVVALALAGLGFGVIAPLGRGWVIFLLIGLGLALVAALTFGLRRFRRPSRAAARARVDRTLSGQPLSALRDHQALGGSDPGSAALWRAHQDRMRREAEKARPIAPDAGLAARDPFALRLAGLTAIAMVAIFAPAGEIGQNLTALGATLRPLPETTPTVPGGPGWEGWAQPPAYTRRPTIYLNALPEGEALVLPKGSLLSFRLYGEGAQVTQDIGPDQPRISGATESPAATAPAKEPPPADPMAPQFLAEESGVVSVAGRRFEVTVEPDALPVVTPGAAPTRRADGRLVQSFTASDDNGIAAGKAVISLDLAAVDRRFGLTVAPEPRDEISLDLPLPATGTRKEISGQLVADLARHPWANLPVQIRLEVSDGIDQQGQSAPMEVNLPGRRFFDPLAAGLIEMRRDLLWSRENAAGTAQILRAMTWQPEGFLDDTLFFALRAGIGRLEAGDLSEKDRDQLAAMLWDAAIALEDGGLSDALERMKQAQERLSEAIRNGASPDEVQRLMDELRAATDAYTDMLAERGEDSSAKFDRSPKDQRQRITGDQIQQMMDEIQRLMNEGRMAEAQELLNQFNRMMENLQISESQDQNGAGRGRPLNRLSETLRDQQKLSDEIMRDLQDQFMPPDEGQEGEDRGQQQGQGQPGQSQDDQPGGRGSFAERQRALREELGRQRGLLPGQGSQSGDMAARELDQAGRAMEEAEQALRDGDSVGAMERQAEAIQSMREGMRALGDMLAQDQNQQQGDPSGNPQGRPEGNQPGNDSQSGRASDPRGERALALPYSRAPSTDPLGRQSSGQGNTITGGDPLGQGLDPSQTARGLLDEIRRRLGERQRSEAERDYLGRLLDRF